MSGEIDPLRDALPGYDIEGELGRGGWGVVYGAEHRALERQVAIKALPLMTGADPETRARFRAEARVVASLDHPHIVPLFDFVEREDLCLFVMELMPGGTLWDRFSADDRAPERGCAVVLAMLMALAHAHERGVLHRDIKPENVLFNAAGVPKLADFGIAKVVDESTGTRTATGVIMGTPAYMAPEQGAGEKVTPATDVYAVGVMLYELLAGQLPFDTAGGAMSLLYRHSYEDPAPLREVAPAVPAALAEVTMVALAKAPADRHESARSFAAELDRAATAALGGDWLTRSNIPVLASKDVFDSGGAPERPAPSVETRPPPPPPPTPLAPPGLDQAAPAAPPVTADPQPQTSGRRTWLLAAAAVLVLGVVAAVSAVVLTSDGDDVASGDDEAPVEISRAAEARFRDSCRTNGVGEDLCTCALDRSLAQLTPEQFLANDRLLVQTGDGLTAEVEAIFSECLDEIE